MYCERKREYSWMVKEAKKNSNTNHILQSSNPCKSAWEIVNSHRKSGPVPMTMATPDEFNNYFANVADNIISSLPDVQTDPVATMMDPIPGLRLIKWKETTRP
ncbi:uncharacterized protein LOC124360624 [Homalodisca vitripennis]|uniref:uncharacterized protein LOC124360624 n=1 Tax=Homalodisca vitripennis TaxID=197043 RepID=UPI001EEBA97D|nr:uncharacterized protein LOC124360624 [Homalodisca vitripennis]